MKIYISKKPDDVGGGSNTFAYNFNKWAGKAGYQITETIVGADWAILIANYGEVREVKRAKKKGCYIVHRIDEYFQKKEDIYRRRKHRKIHKLNKYADVTVFQSNFVYENAFPFLRPANYKVIYNGADSDVFYPADTSGEFIGHVTWGVGEKKRLDILHQLIIENPQEKFLLVGRHQESPYDFNLPNVTLKGPTRRGEISKVYRRMKILVYPSQNDPCPNTVVEAILSGVPVCYNHENPGGIPEIVKDCGGTLDKFKELLNDIEKYRQRCMERKDLLFEQTANQYLSL